MRGRTNDEWLQALDKSGPAKRTALADLRDYLFRAAYLYLRDHRTDTNHWGDAELRHMAEDFAQEALISIRANLGTFRGDAKFTTWAYRFVINAAAARLRRRYYRGKLSLERLPEQEREVLMSLKQPRGMDPDLAAERHELLETLLHIIQTELSDRQRAAIVAVHFEERSMQEVAAELETSTNTLYKILFDARKKIKANLITRHLSGGDILALFEVWL